MYKDKNEKIHISDFYIDNKVHPLCLFKKIFRYRFGFVIVLLYLYISSNVIFIQVVADTVKL